MEYAKRITEFLQSHRLLRHLLFWLVVVAMYVPIGMLDDDSILVILIMNGRQTPHLNWQMIFVVMTISQ